MRMLQEEHTTSLSKIGDMATELERSCLSCVPRCPVRRREASPNAGLTPAKPSTTRTARRTSSLLPHLSDTHTPVFLLAGNLQLLAEKDITTGTQTLLDTLSGRRYPDENKYPLSITLVAWRLVKYVFQWHHLYSACLS
ncbi:hypothetical protein J4Q44_G00307330 [Coregonus suidteri]|uniref:Uncharacterized protein n=1 Tax=Coregonus suidteri TaxID=861788 RepID=A0AAN8QJ75_9TELE